MIALGDSFHFNVDLGHLWMVITDPYGSAGNFLMVNMTSLRAHVADTTCILKVGEHPEVVHDSVVYYQDAREWWVDGDRGYDQILAKGLITPRLPLSRALLRRIQNGALASPYFKRKYVARVQACLVI
jgi:hypothetical protein